MTASNAASVRRAIVAALFTAWGAAAHALPASGQQESLEPAIEAYEAGRLDEAFRRLALLVDGSHEAMARAYLGRIHHGRGAFDDAEEQLERALELEPDNADISYWLASAYLDHIAEVSLFGKRGQADKALNALVATLYLDPGHVDARVSLAEYYLNAPGIAGGSKEQAREQMAAIVQLDPRRGYLFEAEVHADSEEWDAAWDGFERALSVAPDDPEALYAAGMFRQGRGEWADALELLERAARTPVTPGNRPYVRGALYQVGRTGALSGERLDRARDALLEFVQRFPEHEDALSPGARWRLGMIYEMSGEVDAARAAYSAALELDPDHEEARAALRKLRR